MTRARAWLFLLALTSIAWLYYLSLVQGCTCVVNEVSPTANAADSGLVELDDSGADSL